MTVSADRSVISIFVNFGGLDSIKHDWNKVSIISLNFNVVFNLNFIDNRVVFYKLHFLLFASYIAMFIYYTVGVSKGMHCSRFQA